MKFLLLHNIDQIGSRFTATMEQMQFISNHIYGNQLMFDDGYKSVYKFLHSADERICSKTTLFLVVERIGWINDWDEDGELTGLPLLNWEQILELKSLGVKFGSHSLTHADLRKLGDKELEKETKVSKEILEENLGCPVEGFSYPYGYFNERVIAAVKDAGYKWAVTTSDSIWEGFGNPYRMRRINISGLDSKFLIWSKMTGLYDIKSFWKLPVLALEKLALLLKR